MPAIKYHVDLTQPERGRLLKLIRSGKSAARTLTRARILLKADEGTADKDIASALNSGKSTVFRTRKRFVEEGLEPALRERPRPGQRRKLDGKQEAHLVAIACSDPPQGHSHWALRLLASKVVELGFVESIRRRRTIRQTLKKTTSSPGSKRPGASRR